MDCEENIYQVIVEHTGDRPAWYSPMTTADLARKGYAVAANKIWRGGIKKVVLLRHGIVVAVANEKTHGGLEGVEAAHRRLDSEELNPMLTHRELATVLAALRYWQRSDSADTEAESDIATDGGTIDAMQPDEIDDLCERLNTLTGTNPTGSETAKPRLRMVCAHCGDDQVLRDAFAEWSVEKQEWELNNVFDNAVCAGKCDGNECIIDEEVIEEGVTS